MKKAKRLWVIPLLLVVIAAAILAIYKGTHILYLQASPKEYSEYVTKYSQEYGVDEHLVYAVIRCESSFNPEAVSHVGARGLMQLMDETYQWARSRMKDERDISYDDIFDPELNIQYGTYVLKLLLDEFPSPETAIAAYHAGWGNVKKWLDDPEKSDNGQDLQSIPFGNTDKYVRRVMHTKQIYDKLYK